MRRDMTASLVVLALGLAIGAGCGGGSGSPGPAQDATATQPEADDGAAVDATGSAEDTGMPGVRVPPGPDGSDDGDTPADAPADGVPDDSADVPPLEDGSTDLPTDGDEAAEGSDGDTETPDGDDATGPDPATGADTPDAEAVDEGPLTAARCFADQLPASGIPPVDYDQFHPVMGFHCKGTNHQRIEGVQRVVVAGDSITTGTPPTPSKDWYRNRMADALAQRFGLEAPGLLWRELDLTNGVSLQQSSGDFWCCAKFGARTDDLTLEPHRQLVACNPEDQRSRRTLIVMTVGGNDIFAWAQDMVDGVALARLWADAEKAIEDLENAIHWVVDDPATFPGGVYVVFANTFAFNDVESGSDLAKCTGSGIISMDRALIDPDFIALATWYTTQYMRIAVETGTDMVFLGEAACGHGYMRDDPAGRCYRGPGAELWLDVTCMHPGTAGHAGIADLFLSTIFH